MATTIRYDDEVLAERVRLLYANGPAIIAGNLVASGLLAFILWSDSRAGGLLTWIGMVVLVNAARSVLLFNYQRQPRRISDTVRWGARFAVGSLSSSSLWGVAGVVFFSTEPASFVAFVMLFGGVVLASLAAHASYFPAYVAHVTPVVLPFALRCLAEGGGLYVGTAVASLLFLLLNIAFARNTQASVVEALRLRFENLGLVGELRRQKNIAEEANVAKSRFLAAAGHDLRQPVYALALLIDALAADVSSERGRRVIASLRSANHGLAALLDALLDFSKIDAGAITPDIRPVPLAPLLAGIEREFTAQAEAKGLQLRVRVRDAWVLSDPALLERILRNLVANAIKYTRKGGVLIVCRRGHPLRLQVWDSGVGIPESKLQEVFREFCQLDNPERDRNKGLGLGLAIVDGLVRLLGHPLNLRSRPGHGSCFSLALPITAPVAAAAAEPVVGGLDPLFGARILVVDDDATIRNALVELFERWCCDARVVESAAAARELLANDTWLPEAILVDYRLRDGCTGLDALPALHGLVAPGVPAAIITGDTAADRLLEAQASGLPLLHKPITGARLRAILSELLKK